MKTLTLLSLIPVTLTAALVALPGAEADATASAGERLAPPTGDSAFDPADTALVVTDPQVDFLSPEGVTWGVVGDSVTANNTVANIETLFQTAKREGYPVFISPHYYYPHDKRWLFEGKLEAMMHEIGMFDRADPLSLESFEGSGADWLERYKPYIEDGATVVTSPHKVYGPDTNDLVLQLRKRGVDRVILAGMSANLCTESHLRELLEQGFDVTVVSDGTAAAKTPELGDGYAAALTNFRFLANAVLTTKQVAAAMSARPRKPSATTVEASSSNPVDSPVRYGTETVGDLEIFYREAGTPGAPQIVLLHGFPTSSHMFRDLIAELSDDFHVIAPDYPGYGLSAMPAVDEFEYSFANIANVVDELLGNRGFDRYTMYLMDYGAPIGFRIAEKHPERVAGFVIQNGNAYDEGLREFWDPIKKYWDSGSAADRDALRGLLTLDATVWQYQHGTRDPESISPDNWLVVQPLLDRPGNQEIQLAMFYDYRTNVALYPRWQRYFREHRPPTLIAWGKNDAIFPADGAHPYLRDLPDAELHLLDTGHFALEEDGARIAELIREFVVERAAAAVQRNR